MPKHIMYVAAIAFTLTCSALTAQAGPIIIVGDGTGSTSGLGTYSAALNYTATDATHATLDILVTNTTASGNGYLTAFVLNNPGNAITGASLTVLGNSHFQVMGGSTFQNTINGQPFGDFDLGASTGGSFEGSGPSGGSPSNGIAAGTSADFKFHLTGSSLTTLSESSFINTLSKPRGNDSHTAFFVARFRGFPGDDDAPNSDVPTSDKVPGHRLNAAPEPSTFILAGLSICLGLVYPTYRRLRMPGARSAL